MKRRRIIAGTRGSTLALTQSGMVLDALRAQWPEYDFAPMIIRTEGDDGKVEQVGAFTSAIERALYEGRIDMAVHSMKDMPTSLPPELVVGAVPQRANPLDALVCTAYDSLNDLPAGATVGTSSRRRSVLIRRIRPDLVIAPLRGNVDTRLRRLDEGEFDAIILAAAGLERLGFQHRITEALQPAVMMPAVAQGALAVEIRAADGELRELLACVEHRETRLAVTAERAFLTGLGGGCRSPIGAHATVAGDVLTLEGLVAEDTEPVQVAADRLSGPADSAADLGRLLAERILTGRREE